MQKSKGQNSELFENRILTIDEVAAILKKSKSTIYRKTSQKKIPFYKKDGSLYFMSRDIYDWVQKGAA